MSKSVKLLYDFDGSTVEDGLSCKANDIVQVIDEYKDWYWVQCGEKTGFIPSNYAQIVASNSGDLSAAGSFSSNSYVIKSSVTSPSSSLKRDPDLQEMLLRRQQIASVEIDSSAGSEMIYEVTSTLTVPLQQGNAGDDTCKNTGKAGVVLSSTAKKYEFKRNPELDKLLRRKKRQIDGDESFSTLEESKEKKYEFKRDPELDRMLRRKQRLAEGMIVDDSDIEKPPAQKCGLSQLSLKEKPGGQSELVQTPSKPKMASPVTRMERPRESEAVSPVLHAQHIPKSFFMTKPKDKCENKLANKSIAKSEPEARQGTEISFEKNTIGEQPNAELIRSSSTEEKPTVFPDEQCSSKPICSDQLKQGGVVEDSQCLTESVADPELNDTSYNEPPSPEGSPPPIEFNSNDIKIGRTTAFALDALLGDLDLEQDLLETISETSDQNVANKAEEGDDYVDMDDLYECEVVQDYVATSCETLSIRTGERVWGVTESGDWTQIRTEHGEDGFVPTFCLSRVYNQQLREVVVLYAYQSSDENHLSVEPNDILEVWEENNGWLQARNGKGEIGWIPANYVEFI